MNLYQEVALSFKKVGDPGLVVFSWSNHAGPYFLVWWSLTAQEKGLLQDLKKMS